LESERSLRTAARTWDELLADDEDLYENTK
jgi:hypothetical protein